MSDTQTPQHVVTRVNDYRYVCEVCGQAGSERWAILHQYPTNRRSYRLQEDLMDQYPKLVRNQGHSYHDYTLWVAENVSVRLTERQLLSLNAQITEDQAPISDESLAIIRAQLDDVRATRRLT